jgi:hypothetical protein
MTLRTLHLLNLAALAIAIVLEVHLGSPRNLWVVLVHGCFTAGLLLALRRSR